MTDVELSHVAGGPSSSPTRLRWIFIGAAALVSLVIAGAVLASVSEARALGDAIVRGQAETLFHTVHRLAPPGPPPPTRQDLQAVLDESEDLGLRYIAVIPDSTEIDVEVGERSDDLVATVGQLRPGGISTRDGLVIAIARAGPEGSRGPPPGGPPRGRPPGGPPPRARDFGPPPGAGPGGRSRPRLVIEFRPTMLNVLESRSQRLMMIGAASIALLWIGAVLLWRSTGRTAAAEADAQTQRHLATLGQMSAVVAHELRNPLASLKGHAQLLLEDATAPRISKKAKRVVDEAVRLQALIDSLLDFVRSGRVERAATTLGPLLREAAASSAASPALELDGAPEQWRVDGPRIRQVLVNLLDNAHQAAPDGPIVVVATQSAGDLVIEVRDRGPGVPTSARELVFAPFHTGRTQGTGLGLPVARRIVELHDGTLSCDDHTGGGAIFRIRLPA